MTSNRDLPTIELGYSSLRIFGMIGAGILMTLTSACLAFQWIPTEGLGLAGMLKSAVGVVAGYVGLLFFGVATAAAIWLLLKLPNGPIVTISRDGICDKRIAEEVIPWKLVADISQPSGERLLVLRLSRAADHVVFHHRLKGPVSLAKGTFSVNGLRILTIGFNVTTEALLQTCRTYHAAARTA
ncbi:hypothetical protein [Bradyrhizobium stylosanthis]|uniref:Uncharacterized protein n=1 Tax=Bradyrhizobium stylosanthis TaxID=1803665 RepID=A0A560DNM4_9BRAD|nr:hypothetical protein [Bradyrhizobium stylosanthis]TWA98642.1 hypothetical protein FBZ96_105320 [Bradyrhizobium stylosanthis]